MRIIYLISFYVFYTFFIFGIEYILVILSYWILIFFLVLDNLLN